MFARPGGHRENIAVVDAALHDHVDLDRNPEGSGGCDPLQHPGDPQAPSATTQAGEGLGIQAVEADIDPIQTGIAQGRSGPSQEPTIGGQRNDGHPQFRLEQADQLRDVGPQQGFPR